jgi:hypothetical protein
MQQPHPWIDRRESSVDLYVQDFLQKYNLHFSSKIGVIQMRPNFKKKNKNGIEEAVLHSDIN